MEELGSKKNIKNSLFGNAEKEEKEKGKDNISLFGQEDKIEDENKSSLFGKLSNLFTRLYKSFDINNYNDDNGNNDNIDNNRINFRGYSSKDQSKIKVPENSLNEGKTIFHQHQSKDSEEKLDDKNIKINCGIMEPKKKTFSINISRSNDISYLKLLICLQLNRNDNFYFLKTNSFCLLKNYCFIKETGTVEDCGIKDGDNIYIILKNIMRKYVDKEIK